MGMSGYDMTCSIESVGPTVSFQNKFYHFNLYSLRERAKVSCTMMCHLNLSLSLVAQSYTGGGKFAPDITNLSAISVPIALGSPKFMTLFHSMSDPS